MTFTIFIVMILASFIRLSFFFFFQAEDGIRDPLVTGVQTCALPICRPRARPCTWRHPRRSQAIERDLGSGDGQGPACLHPRPRARLAPPASARLAARRSEERRVGKECRSRGGSES